MADTTPPPGPVAAMPRGTVIVVTLAAVLICAIGLRQFSSMIGPLMLALVFTITAAPIRRILKARGAPNWAATGAMVVTVYLVVFAFAWGGLALGTHFAGLVASYADNVEALLQDWVGQLASIGIDADQLTAAAGAIDVGKAADVVLGLLGGLVNVLTSFFFLVVLLFFTVLDAGSFADNLARISGRGARIADSLRSFARGTFSYMIVATIFGAIVAVADVIALTALGVPDAWMWGLLAFFTNYIPNVGFVIGVIPPAFIALVDKGVGTAVAVVVCYSVINFVIQMIVQPRVVGRTVGLSATLTFLSLLWWGAIFGGVGAIIAVPLTILVKSVFIDHDEDHTWLRPLLESGGSDPETADPDVEPGSGSGDAAPSVPIA